MRASDVKTMILAGGLGTRMQELTQLVPKPMIEIGGWPILWHIMKIYAYFGVNDFAIALGYRGDVIKDYFLNYNIKAHSMRIDLGRGVAEPIEPRSENWVIDLVDTGEHAQTGARIARMRPFLGERTFFLTYGDGVGDIDISDLLAFHRSHGGIATVTAVRPPSKFGALDIRETARVAQFSEKPVTGDTWINGGFFALEARVFDYLRDDDSCAFEQEPLEALAADGQLSAYRHHGYWRCIDTKNDVAQVNAIWNQGNAAWKLWSEDETK